MLYLASVNWNFPVDIFCRIVDNYGDAGVVLRLIKGLTAAAPNLEIRLIIDDLSPLSKLLPEIEPGKPVQQVRNWTLILWDHPWEGFASRPARLVIESLACGRPEPYDKIFFDPSGTEEVVHVNLEYLSAENYAEEFHCLPSFSPIKRVKKYFILPGFTPKTGGLVLDPSFMEKKRYWNSAAGKGLVRREKALSWGISLPRGTEDAFWISVFVYDADFSALIEGLAHWNRPKLLLVPEGGFRKSLLTAWEAAGKPFPVILHSFLPQDLWDDLLLACDLSLVRGEESLSRAALGGRPFLWQAYPQKENYQRVKVEALVERMRAHVQDPDSFSALSLAFERLNGESSVPAAATRDYLRFFRLIDQLKPCYRAFSDSLAANGDLSENILRFFREQISNF